MRVQVLGRLTVIDDHGQPLPVDDLPRRARQVLGVLAARHDRPQSKDALADAVWGEELPGNHVAALEHYVSLIRRTLEPGQAPGASFILTRSSGYVFSTDRASLDLAELRGLARLADSHQPGESDRLHLRQQQLDLCGDLPFDEDEYADWASTTRAEVRTVMLTALRELAEAAVSTDPERALRLAAEAINTDPYAEPPYRVAMRAAAALGRTDDALRWFDKCQQALAQELGVPPSGDTLAVRDAILARHTEGGESSARPSRTASVPDAGFIGRKVELDLILGEHATRVAHLVGPVGSGKSAMLAEVARRAPERVGVGRGPGAEGTGTLRLTWLRSALAMLPMTEQARSGVEQAMAERRGLSVAELELIATELNRIDWVVFAIDDAAELDAESVTELGWLQDHCPRLRLVLAYQYPSALAGRPVANLGADVVLRLPALTEQELGATQWDLTGGIPGLVAVADRPAAVTDGVAMHIARVRTRMLPESAWEMLRLTAALGPLNVSELRELTGLPVTEVLTIVDHLVHAHLLTEQPDGKVRHRAALIRTAVASQVSAAHARHLREQLDNVQSPAGEPASPQHPDAPPLSRRRRVPAGAWNRNPRPGAPS